jgi:hypothetical protein
MKAFFLHLGFFIGYTLLAIGIMLAQGPAHQAQAIFIAEGILIIIHVFIALLIQ